MSFNSLSSNAARLTQRLTESLNDLSVSSLTSTGIDLSNDAQIQKQLASSSDREKLEAVKAVIHLMSLGDGRGALKYFASVVKLLPGATNTSLPLRSLIYLYLSRFATQEPDLTLLSINALQRDTKHSNAAIRSQALRTLANVGVAVPGLLGVVREALRSAASDPSPYVRRVAALVVIKCFVADPSSPPTAHINSIFNTNSTIPLGTAAIAFLTCHPTPSPSWQILHFHFRRLCRSLPDMDSWGQIWMIQLLGRYARAFLPRPIADKPISQDLSLLFTSASPLVYSQNPAARLAYLQMHHHLSAVSQFPQPSHVKLFIALFQNPETTFGTKSISRIVLSYIIHLISTSPKGAEPWKPHLKAFILRSDDPVTVKRLKLHIMLSILDDKNVREAMVELIYQIKI